MTWGWVGAETKTKKQDKEEAWGRYHHQRVITVALAQCSVATPSACRLKTNMMIEKGGDEKFQTGFYESRRI